MRATPERSRTLHTDAHLANHALMYCKACCVIKTLPETVTVVHGRVMSFVKKALTSKFVNLYFKERRSLKWLHFN